MSITVRLWSPKDFQEIDSGNTHMATVLLNKATYNKDELLVMREIPRKTYECSWRDSQGVETASRVFFAVDDESLQWFLYEEYAEMPTQCVERTTTYRTVVFT